MINVDHPNVLELFQEYRGPNRWDSAAYLIWYLENYYRLTSTEAVDSVCDKFNDKGVDGIWIDEDDETIVVFQSRLSESSRKSVGDAALRPFAGTLRQFETVAALEAMTHAAGLAQVASLVNRLDLLSKIGRYKVRGEFLSNLNIDSNGTPYLTAAPNITFIGKQYLESRYISASRDLPSHPSVTFNTRGYTVTQHKVDAHTKAVIVPVKASELVKLDGVSDQSLFHFNVRGPLGKTSINKAIVTSIKDRRLHKAFPLFHNGITIICTDLKVNRNDIVASDYHVVNGCQSLTALFDNQGALTANLRILTKFIELEKDSPLAATITKFSNNQNGVKARDFMANNATQIRLQNEFDQNYAGQYFLEIKRGEKPRPGITISNEAAGLYLMSFDLQEPWATHRSYQVFVGDKHTEIFGKPHVNADRIVMLRVVMDAVESAISKMDNKLCAGYVLTRYFMMYTLRLIIDHDPIAVELLKNPKKFVRNPNHRDHFRDCVRSVADDVVIDLNLELAPLGEKFDYRDSMRDQEWVKRQANEIVGTRTKMISRKKITTLKEMWDS